MDIAGSAGLVTGGASGLGEATVRRLVAAGARVAIVDRNPDKGEVLAKELGDAAVFVAADVANADEVAAAVEQATALGPLRIAVSCAGIGWAQRTVGKEGVPHDLSMFEMVLRVNVVGSFNVMRLAGSAMSKTDPLEDGERGVLVNTASVAAFDGQIGQISYSASKAAVVGMTLPAARDLAPIGIRVCTICPGTMDTPMLGMLPEAQKQALVKDVQFPKRLGRPDDFAALVEHIARNSYLNGETIRLDGGLRMPPR